MNHDGELDGQQASDAQPRGNVVFTTGATGGAGACSPEGSWHPFALLSHAEAKAAGEAMFDRAHLMAPDLRLGMTADDAGWADMFRAGWEAVRALRGGR